MITFILDHAPMIGLLFFFFFFVATAIWVYRPGSRATYQKYADIPFVRDEK